MRFRRLGNWVFLFSLALFLLALDQATKYIVRQNLAVGEAWAPIPALSEIFTITHVRNTGVAFGQLAGLGWIFMLVNLGVLVAVLIYYPRIPAGNWLLRVAMALVLAGDVGNVIDRLRTAFLHSQVSGNFLASLPYAYVTDFFHFKYWAVFNVADMCVVSGTAIIAWVLWQAEKAEMAKEQSLAHDQ